MPITYYGKEARKKINRSVKREQKRPAPGIGLPTLGHQRRELPDGILVKTPALASLPARTGSTPGSANCHVYVRNSSGQLQDTGAMQTIFNALDTSFLPDTFIPAVKEQRSGIFIATGSKEARQALIAKTSAGTPIDARDGTVISSQSCEIFGIAQNQDTMLFELITTNEFENVYNVSDQEVPEDTYFPIVQEETTSKWLAASPGKTGGRAVIVRTDSPGLPIPPISTDTVSSESCDIFEIDEATGELVQTDDDPIQVYNISKAEIPGDNYFGAVEQPSGLWFSTTEFTDLVETERCIFDSTESCGLAILSGNLRLTLTYRRIELVKNAQGVVINCLVGSQQTRTCEIGTEPC